MENHEVQEQAMDLSENAGDAPRSNEVANNPAQATLSPQTGEGGCGCGRPGGQCACGAQEAVSAAETGGMAPSYIYAIGSVEARFPTMAVEKECAQAMALADTEGMTDRQALHKVLTQNGNRYLARQMCWVFSIEGLETYILQPSDPVDLSLLVDCLRPEPSPADVDVIIGVRGPIAPPEVCNGLMVPIVMCDQVYTFDRDSLIAAIPIPDGYSEKDFRPAAEEVFDRIMQMTDNAGASDEHRALNYLALRYPAIYNRAAEAFAENYSLTAVQAHLSPLSGTRNIVEVIFVYTNRQTDFTEKYSVDVDTTEEFPFLSRPLSPYFDR